MLFYGPVFGQTGLKPAPQSPLLLFPSKEVYSSSLTHPHTSHFLTPADPSTLMCVTQGGDSQRWRGRHKGAQAISICLCPPAFPPLCLSLIDCGLLQSVGYVTHWPMTWLVSDSHQSTFLFHNDSYRTIYDLNLFKILLKNNGSLRQNSSCVFWYQAAV